MNDNYTVSKKTASVEISNAGALDEFVGSLLNDFIQDVWANFLKLVD